MKTRPCLTERLLMGRKESNQTHKQTEAQNHGLSCESRPWMRGGGDEDLTVFLRAKGGGDTLKFSCT